MPRDEIHAPMACTVVELRVSTGQAVRAGQTLLVIEAMKMEHEICARCDGQVLQVSARAGELVAQGDVLIRLGAVAVAVAPAPPAALSAAGKVRRLSAPISGRSGPGTASRSTPNARRP